MFKYVYFMLKPVPIKVNYYVSEKAMFNWFNNVIFSTGYPRLVERGR